MKRRIKMIPSYDEFIDALNTLKNVFSLQCIIFHEERTHRPFRVLYNHRRDFFIHVQYHTEGLIIRVERQKNFFESELVEETERGTLKDLETAVTKYLRSRNILWGELQLL